MVKSHRLPLAARRVFRLASVTALSLTLAYGLGLDIPFLAPLFAVLLTANPGSPPGAKQLLILVLVLNLTLGIGVLLGPLLQLAPVPALIAIALGLFFSNRLGIVGGKPVPATLLAFGFTVVPAASTVSQALAATLISALVTGVVVAVICQWLAYSLFPEDSGPLPPQPPPPAVTAGNWLSLRATLIVLPAFLFTLTNPLAYLPLTVKSILLGREATEVRLRAATREMVGSTAFGGLCAIAVWLCLGLAVELWFFGGWILLCSMGLASGTYRMLGGKLTPGFWINTLTTMLILLGSAVQDSVNGKDVYQAFAIRMALFLAVTLYAVAAMALLERLRTRRANPSRGALRC